MTSQAQTIRLARNSSSSSSDRVLIRIGQLKFLARWEASGAPRTCELFQSLLPLNMKMIHCSWSGEGGWIPLGKWDAPWYPENQTSNPSPGQLLLYAPGPSEPELLIPYGVCIFNSKYGVLAGNHLLTIVEGQDNLPKLKHMLLWQGAQDCRIEQI